MVFDTESISFNRDWTNGLSVFCWYWWWIFYSAFPIPCICFFQAFFDHRPSFF